VAGAADPLACVRPLSRAHARLVCFAHAGGGPAAYRKWPLALAPEVEVWTATLPGRAARSEEAFAASWEDVVEGLAAALSEQQAGDDRPQAILGHSLGAILAFEVARALERRPGSRTSHLFVSGCRSPQRIGSRWQIPDDDQRLVSEIDLRFGAVPAAVRAEPELLRRFVPVLRADLGLAASYAFRPGDRLRCPITAICGLEDRTASAVEIAHWEPHTAAGFEAVTMPGAHFFLHQELPAMADLVKRVLGR
jgi:medium-chain acyl-[acyl-carrier-protein] hydrolase